jgi:PPM family protein phosphatase
MKVRVGAGSDEGRVRDHNEDSYLLQEPLFAVADGMGGHAGGEVASSLALEMLAQMPVTSAGEGTSLAEEFRKANQVVLDRAEAERELSGMGTTLTAVLTDGITAHVGHIGDSRAYLVRNGELRQVTEDDSLVHRMVDAGKLSPEEAGRHPSRSILTRALGVKEDISVQEKRLELQPGDRLLLCTDGLTGMVSDEEIQEILDRNGDPQDACNELIQAANKAGGLDNITVVLIDFLEG